jgi:hypothetical protein
MDSVQKTMMLPRTLWDKQKDKYRSSAKSLLITCVMSNAQSREQSASVQEVSHNVSNLQLEILQFYLTVSGLFRPEDLI